MYRREKSWYMRCPDLDFSPFFICLFPFYDFLWLIAQGSRGKSMIHKIYERIPHFKVGRFIAYQGLGQSWVPRRRRIIELVEPWWWPWWWGRAHVLDFCDVLNVCVSTIFFILWYIFLLNVTKYSFLFLFSCINLWASFHACFKVWAKGRGELTLCGTSGGMWT